MALQDTARTHLYRLGAGVQTAAGTPQTTTLYEQSLYGGGISPTQDEREHAATTDSDITIGYYIASAHMEGAPVTAAHPDAVGVWLIGHLGTPATADTVTGSGSNRIHTMVYSETKAFLTVVFKRPGVGGGSADRWEIDSDIFVPKLEIAFAQGDPLKLTPTLLGATSSFNPGSTPTFSNDALLKAAGPYLTMIGAVFTSDIDATPATTVVHNVTSGVFTSEYENTELEFTDAVTAQYLDRGRLRIGVSLDIKFQDYGLFSQTFYGAKTGTGLSLSSNEVTGALTMLFGIGPAADANRSLSITLPSTQYKIAPPEPDPGGGPVTATISTRVVRPASGQAATYVLKNSVVAY